MGQLSASDKAKLLSFGAPKAKLTSSGVEPVALALPGAPPRPALAGAASTNLSLKAASLKLREERRKDDRPDKQVTAAGLQMVTESITRLDRRERPEDSDFDLQVLVSRAAKYLKSSTLDGYAGSVERWKQHCEAQEREPFPVDPWRLADYIAHETLRLQAGGNSASPLCNLRSALKSTSQLAGESDPYVHAAVMVMHMAGIRELGFHNNTKDPLFNEHVRSIVRRHGGAEAPSEKLGHLAQLALANEAALRWDDLKAIRYGDLVYSEDLIRIFLVRTKTDAYAEGQWAAILPSRDPTSAQVLFERHICQLAETWEQMPLEERSIYAPWCDSAGDLLLTEIPLVALWSTTASGYSFPAPGAPKTGTGKHHRWGMTPEDAKKAYNQYNHCLKSLAAELGLDPSKIATHSNRRGWTTETIANGMAESFAKVQGRWRSDKSVTRYIDDEVALRKHVRGLQERDLLVKPPEPFQPESPTSKAAAALAFPDDDDNHDLRSTSPLVGPMSPNTAVAAIIVANEL